MPTCEQMRLCRPIWQLWAICTRLSIFVPSPIGGRAVGAAVDRGAGADFDVVADAHVAELRGGDVAAVDLRIAEAVGADDGAAVNRSSDRR